MKPHYRLDVELTLIGPVLTAGGDMSEPGIDVPMARDHLGRYMLPFSLIKGKVIDAITELNGENFEIAANSAYRPTKDKNWLRDWLGNRNGDGHYEPERGRLAFSDFYTESPGLPGNIIERNEIDAATGATRDQMLVMLQAPFGYGEPVVFHGKIEFIADREEATKIASTIENALRWVPAYGAHRTTGFGRTKNVKLELTKLAESAITSVGNPPLTDTLSWQLRLDRPFCLVGRKHAMNHFESLDTISGTVLKGAIADLIKELLGSQDRDVSKIPGDLFPKLREHFAKIRFTEARPIQVATTGKNPDKAKPTRPVEPPLSIVRCPIDREEFRERYFDVALCEGPHLLYAADDIDRNQGAAPAFRPDWKGPDYAVVRKAFGWPQIERQRRTRTAIDYRSGKASEAQLFSYGLTLPETRDGTGSVRRWEWVGDIGLQDIPFDDRQAVRDDLKALVQFGIPRIGKTRATAAVTWLEAAHKSPWTELSDDVYVVTLQTECLMTNPSDLDPGTPNTLQDAYKDYWKEVSGGSLSVVRFFATQSLHGGYVSRRAQHHGGGRSKYEPFLLTDRGSVFTLQATDINKAKECLVNWEQTGLPEAKWVTARYGAPLWERCPFIRQNGYGEVAVNLPCHTIHRSQDKTPQP